MLFNCVLVQTLNSIDFNGKLQEVMDNKDFKRDNNFLFKDKIY